MIRHTYTVSVVLNEKDFVSKSDMREYIRDAVQSSKGGYLRGHPMFGVTIKKVTVKPVKKLVKENFQ